MGLFRSIYLNLIDDEPIYMDEVEDVKEAEGEISEESLDGILDEAVEEEEEVAEETTDEFGNPKDEEKTWE